MVGKLSLTLVRTLSASVCEDAEDVVRPQGKMRETKVAMLDRNTQCFHGAMLFRILRWSSYTFPIGGVFLIYLSFL